MRADVGLDVTVLFSSGLGRNDIGAESSLDRLLVLRSDKHFGGHKGLSPLTILVPTKRQKKNNFFWSSKKSLEGPNFCGDYSQGVLYNTRG